MPVGRRRGVLATYAYCRIADDIVDEALSLETDDPAEALARWERELDYPSDPVAVAFADTRDRFDVPLQPVRDLITGARMDLNPAPYASWRELRIYCYHVAGTVGLMVAPILGCRDPRALPHAAELGIAMQLTNILRDVAEDAQMGRLYLPLDEIAAFGCDPEAILAGQPGPGFRDLIAFQIDRARSLYAIALKGVPALSPSGRFATLAASRFYAGILDRIEAMDYDVFRDRAYVPSRRKLAALPGVATTVLGMSLIVQPQYAGSPEPLQESLPSNLARTTPTGGMAPLWSVEGLLND
jgi:phytoene synthase